MVQWASSVNSSKDTKTFPTQPVYNKQEAIVQFLHSPKRCHCQVIKLNNKARAVYQPFHFQGLCLGNCSGHPHSFSALLTLPKLANKQRGCTSSCQRWSTACCTPRTHCNRQSIAPHPRAPKYRTNCKKSAKQPAAVTSGPAPGPRMIRGCAS